MMIEVVWRVIGSLENVTAGGLRESSRTTDLHTTSTITHTSQYLNHHLPHHYFNYHSPHYLNHHSRYLNHLSTLPQPSVHTTSTITHSPFSTLPQSSLTLPQPSLSSSLPQPSLTAPSPHYVNHQSRTHPTLHQASLTDSPPH